MHSFEFTIRFLVFHHSFDVRGRSFAKALLWSDQNSFGSRAYFVTVSKPAGLTVDNIHLDDEGVSDGYFFSFLVFFYQDKFQICESF